MDQQFSLSWNNFHGNLSKGFASLLGKAEFVDVTIAVEGHLLQAHKVILSICSPYFKKMFLLNPCQHPIVVLRDVTYKAMKDLLQFMYQGEVSVKREDLNSFIGTAELLEIKGLTNKQGEENSENDNEVNENAPQNDTETNHIHNEASQNEINLKKQCEIIQRLHKFTSLKRKSEEFLQKNYFSTDIFINADKRQKLKEKYNKTSDNAVSSNSFESYHNIYNNNPSDTAINYTNKSDNLSHGKDTPNSIPEESITPDTNIDIKPECSDDDIIVTEPGACTTPKSVDSRLKDAEFPMTQESVSISTNASTENQILPVPYKYIYSRKGHKQLVHMNFVYTKHSTSHGKTSWRCVQYFSLNRCPATVETIDEMIFAVNHQHNHEDSFEKLSKDNVYESH